jgi:hypothetical protein
VATITDGYRSGDIGRWFVWGGFGNS